MKQKKKQEKITNIFATPQPVLHFPTPTMEFTTQYNNENWCKLPLTIEHFPTDQNCVKCSLCRTFVLISRFSPDDANTTLHHADKQALKETLCLEQKPTSYIEHMQRSFFSAIENKFPQFAQYPLCPKCYSIVQKGPRLNANAISKNSTKKKSKQRVPLTQHKKQTNPIASIIHYVSSGAAAYCPEKRSIPFVMHSLARRIKFPDGHLEYNELLYHCPPAFQQIVTWMHTRQLLPQNMQEFIMACAASYWLHNALCFWGGSRDTMRMVRAYSRNHHKHPFLVSDGDFTATHKTAAKKTKSIFK